MAGLSEPPPLLPEDPSEPHHVQGAVRDSPVLPAGDEQAELQREAQARALHASAHEQPCSFTRAEFWAYVEACYKEAYPTTDATGSILSFGLSSFYSSFC